jgi:hypothetical protein
MKNTPSPNQLPRVFPDAPLLLPSLIFAAASMILEVACLIAITGCAGMTTQQKEIAAIQSAQIVGDMAAMECISQGDTNRVPAIQRASAAFDADCQATIAAINAGSVTNWSLVLSNTLRLQQGIQAAIAAP